jgi:predicted deacetylase
VVTPPRPNGGVDTRLLVSLSGIGPRTLHRCAEFAAELDRRDVPLSLLITPRVVEQSGAVLDWLRTRARHGDALLLHGYDHRVAPSHRTVRLGRKAEFAALPAHEARLRLTAASAALERTGLRVDGFAPPRWRASRGTLEVLRERDFAFCADLSGVHDLRTGEVHRARVQDFGEFQHPRTETVRCFALVLACARAARRGGLVRLGVDATDLARPGPRQAILDAVSVATDHGATASTYRAVPGRTPLPR